MLGFLLLLVGVHGADSISNYKVPYEVPLGTDVTIFGQFSDDANVNGDVICSFYLVTDQNALIDRSDDQYTDSLGYFASSFTITEPDFKRTLIIGRKQFVVEQKEPLNFRLHKEKA